MKKWLYLPLRVFWWTIWVGILYWSGKIMLEKHTNPNCIGFAEEKCISHSHQSWHVSLEVSSITFRNQTISFCNASLLSQVMCSKCLWGSLTVFPQHIKVYGKVLPILNHQYILALIIIINSTMIYTVTCKALLHLGYFIKMLGRTHIMLRSIDISQLFIEIVKFILKVSVKFIISILMSISSDKRQ